MRLKQKTEDMQAAGNHVAVLAADLVTPHTGLSRSVRSLTDPRARDWHGMSLEQIQAELRAISGAPLRRNENPVRRRKLWRRLDYLIRQRDATVFNERTTQTVES
jgi:hypothetical protein